VTPRALRLGEPHPHITTSDVLCRPAGAPARAPPRAFAFRATPVFRQEPQALTRRTRSRFDAVRLETTPPRDQGAFLRLDSRSCDRVRSAAQFGLNTRFPRTRSPDTDGAPFVTGELLRRATSRPLGSPRGSPRRREKDASRRPLQPTLDSTSTLGPFESRAATNRVTAPRSPPRRSRVVTDEVTAPARLSATRPQVSPRLTARTQLRPPRSPIRSGTWPETVECRPKAAPPCRGVVDHEQGWRRASDVPCRASRCPPPSRRAAHEEPGSIPLAARQCRRASTTRDAFHRRVPHRRAHHAPAMQSLTLMHGGDPPPISRFCHQRFGFRRSFTDPSLSRGTARPRRGPRAHRSGACEATRRSSTSAIE